MHGITGGMMSEIQGGSFASGFASGALSSLVSSAIQGIGETGGTACVNGKDVPIMTEFGKSSGFKALMLASGGLSGGLSSSIAGGNFYAGVRQGLITSGLNHLAHMAVSTEDLDSAKRTLTPEERQKIGENYHDYHNYPDANSVYENVGGPLYDEYLKNPENYVNTCAIRLSVAFQKSNIDIGGDYTGTKGTKYYTSATRIAKALDSRFISYGQGYNTSGWGINIQYKDKSYTGSVYHVDVIFQKNGQGVFGHTLYSPYYNKFY